MIVPIANPELEVRIRHRLDSLTKPPGSLGRLEEIALRVGLIQSTAMPMADRKAMLIFCADHGVWKRASARIPPKLLATCGRIFKPAAPAIPVAHQ